MFATTSAARAASARPRARAPRRPFPSVRVRVGGRRAEMSCRSPAARASRVVAYAATNASEGESAGAEKTPRRVRKLPPRAKPRAGDARARDGAAPAPSPAAADADPNEDDDAPPTCSTCARSTATTTTPRAFSDDSMDDDSVMEENGVRVIADVPATLLAGDPRSQIRLRRHRRPPQRGQIHAAQPARRDEAQHRHV